MVSQGVTLCQSAGPAACVIFLLVIFLEAGIVHVQVGRTDRKGTAGSSTGTGIGARHPQVFLEFHGRRLSKCGVNCSSNETLANGVLGSYNSSKTNEASTAGSYIPRLIAFVVLTGISAVLLSCCLAVTWCCFFYAFWRGHHHPCKDTQPAGPGSSELRKVASSLDDGETGMVASAAIGEADIDEQGQAKLQDEEKVSLDGVVPSKEDGMPVPGYWRNHGKLSFHEEVETRYVKEAASSLLNKTSHDSFDIIKAHRIEDQSLWAKYLKACSLVRERSKGHCPSCSPITNQHMRRCMRASLDDSVTEVILFHGTSAEKAQGISSTGFNLSFAGATGARLGKGIYFAEKSAKSDAYTKPDKDQVRAMLLCRVCLGKVHTMSRPGDGAKVLVKNPSCDSVVCNTGSYNEFVIFNPALCYPEFVIFYKRRTVE